MNTRRQFLKKTAMATAAPLLPGLDLEPATRILERAAPGFKLLFLATNWGFNGTIDQFCARAKADGYEGIEVWTPQEEKEKAALLEATQKYGLSVGLLCGSGNADFQKHLEGFDAALQKAVAIKPVYINCHSGRDWFSFADNKKIIDLTVKAHQASGVPVYHETHRGRMLFAAHTTRQFIEAVPELRLTLDISHWCNVHESLLNDQEETVQKALERTEHIHTRVGHPEGPQVNDPRAPEWDAALQRHLSWWDTVVKRKAAEGKPLTMLTEFGPPDYLPALPYTRQPVADQWAINVYMKDLLQKRYRTEK